MISKQSTVKKTNSGFSVPKVKGANSQRRRFQRAQVDLPISYSIGGEHAWRTGRLVDISGSGVRIACSSELMQGIPITVTFSLPGRGREVFVEGVAVMSFFDGASGQYSNGIAFTLIFRADQEAIGRYVNEVLLGNLRSIAAADSLNQACDEPERLCVSS